MKAVAELALGFIASGNNSFIFIQFPKSKSGASEVSLHWLVLGLCNG